MIDDRSSADPLIESIRSGKVPDDELVSLLNHKSVLVRANVYELAASRAKLDSSWIPRLRAAAVDARSGQVVMGTVRLSHIAVACLLRIGNRQAVQLAEDLIARWPEPEKDDLLWYLRSQSLWSKSV